MNSENRKKVFIGLIITLEIKNYYSITIGKTIIFK